MTFRYCKSIFKITKNDAVYSNNSKRLKNRLKIQTSYNHRVDLTLMQEYINKAIMSYEEVYFQ